MQLRSISIRPFIPLFLLSFLFLPIHAGLDSLRKYQRECFPDISACFMFMDDQRAYGCAQCDVDIRTELVRRFTQPAQLDSFLDPDNERRIVMMPEYVFFNRDILTSLASATNVAAVVVYEIADRNVSYPPVFSQELSTDLRDPNRRYNIYPPRLGPDDFNRNSIGLGTKFQMYPFNIFRVDSVQGEKIIDLLERFPDMTGNPVGDAATTGRGPTSPRYKLQSVGRMYACPKVDEDLNNPSTELPGDFISRQANSKTCLDQRTCLPIGGQSVWSALGHLEDFQSDDTENRQRRRILAISAPIDSNAFFTDFALGASAEISALAVMMAVAEAVGSFWRKEGQREIFSRPVYFGWNAQSWGYAGSGRFLKDLRDFECPEGNERRKHDRVDGCANKYMNSLKFEQLKGARMTVLNLGQLTTPNSTQDLFTFFRQGETAGGDQPSAEIADLVSELDDAFRAIGMGEREDIQLLKGLDNIMPLDASQSFQKFLPEANVLSVTGYNDSFDNLWYHSMFDNVTLVENFKPVTLAAEAIASAVISIAFQGQEQTIVRIPEDRIKQIVDCLSLKWTEQPCALAEEFLSSDTVDASNERIIPGNYPGSFFPDTRLEDVNESAFLKLSLIRAFLAHQNRFEEQETACTTDADCEDYERELNEESPDSIHVKRVYCARSTCVASDTYTHNAFGPGVESTNSDQTTFTLSPATTPSQTDAPASAPSILPPFEAGWTESVWDFDFGLCGFVEDTPLFGGLILGSGLAVVLISFLVAIRFDRFMFKSEPEEEEFAAVMGDQEAPPDRDVNSRWPGDEPAV